MSDQDQKRLADAGEALFGPRWQTALADAFDPPIAVRNMQRWATGDRGVPATIWPEIERLARRRAARLVEIADELARHR